MASIYEEYPVISIIVPVFNVERTLDKCLQSIADQTFTDLQVILVDDGSPDNCGNICDAWTEKDQRFIVIHQKNQGLSAARNNGLRKANGKYILFVDSDDYLKRTMVEKLLGAAEAKDADVVSCQFNNVASDGGQKINFEQTQDLFFDSSREVIKILLEGKILTTNVWHYLFRREILWENPFEVGCLFEDQLFTVRAISRGSRFILLRDALYYYVENESGIMSLHTVKSLMDWVEAKRKRAAFIEQTYPELSEEAEKAYIDADLLCWSQYVQYHLRQRKELKPLLESTRTDLKNRKKSWMLKGRIASIKSMLIVYFPRIYIAFREIRG